MKNLRHLLPFLILAIFGIFLALLILRMDGGDGGDAGHGHDTHSEEHADEHAENHDEEGEHSDHSEHSEHSKHQEGEDSWESVTLSDAALLQSGAALDTVRVRRMTKRLPLQGKIVLNEDRAAHIHPRFPGLIVEVRKQLGAAVRKGDVLAILESNESLQPYAVIAQMEGTVVSRHASAGETVTADDELFIIADLSTVWVDFQVYRQDFNRLKAGQMMRVLAEGIPSAEVPLAYLSPRLEPHSQSLLARVELPNKTGAWTPGLFVRGEVVVETFETPAVRREAVQQFPDGPVVFVREAGTDRYVAHRITPGRRDGEFVELLSPPLPGEAYVARNSFLLKAEIGKGEAGHDH